MSVMGTQMTQMEQIFTDYFRLFLNLYLWQSAKSVLSVFQLKHFSVLQLNSHLCNLLCHR